MLTKQWTALGFQSAFNKWLKMELPWWFFYPFIKGDLSSSSVTHRPSTCNDPNCYWCIFLAIP